MRAQDVTLWQQTLNAVFSAHSRLAFERRSTAEAADWLRQQQTLLTLVTIEIRKEQLHA